MDLLPGVESDDILKPSLFELLAQEQLRDLLQPAVKYVLSVFAQRYPRYLLRLVNKHEEFYAMLMFFVERHYLKQHGSSFAEHFYALKRRRRPVISMPRADLINSVPSPGTKLQKSDRGLSLLFLVGVPYLRAKAQDNYERIGGGVSVGTRRPSESNLERIKSLYRIGYPWANITFELWLFLYNLKYIFGKTPYYRPWLHWMGLDIRRMDASDMATYIVLPTSQNMKSKTSLLKLFRATGRSVLSSLKYVLPLVIFSLRFLEWLYSPSSPAQALMKADEGVPIPPPRMLLPHPEGLQVDQGNYGQCPICNDSIANATALPSGYVFCYRCAYEEVERHHRCPVTLIPAEIHQLRKVLL